MSAQQQSPPQRPIYLISKLSKTNAKAIKTAEPSGANELLEEINLLRTHLAAHNEINQLKALNVTTVKQVSDVKS